MSKKWVLFSLLLLLVAFSFYLISQSGSLSEKVRAEAERRLQAFVGRPVRIEEAAIRFFAPSVSLKGISTPPEGFPAPSAAPGPGPASERMPLFAAEEIRISFSLWSLLTESFFIRQIDIHAPSFYLDSEALRGKPFVLDDSPGGRRGALPPVIVRAIRIHDARLIYLGEGTLKKLALQKVNAEIRPDLKMSRFKIELSGGEGSASLEKVEKKIDRLEGSLIVTSDQVDLKRVLIASNQALLQGEGNFKFAGDPPVDLRFEAQMPVEELDLAALLPDSFFSEKKLAGKMTLQGHATGSVRELLFNGKVAVPSLLVDGIETGSLHSDLSYERGRIAFSSLTGELFSGTFTGEAEGPLPVPEAGAGSDPQKARYRLALQYKQIPVEKVRKMVAGPGSAAPSGTPVVFEGIFLDGDLSLSGRGADPESWAGGGHLTAKRHPLFSTPAEEEPDRLNRAIALFEEGKLAWKWSEGRWIFGPGSLSFPETTAAFQGEWSPEKGWRLETQVQADEMKKMAEALRLPVTGRMSLQGLLSGKEAPLSFQGEFSLNRWTLLNQPFGPFSTAFETKGREVLFNQGSLGAPPGGKQAPNDRPPYRFNGSLSLADPASPSFSFQVEAAGADPQEFLTLFKQSIPLQTRATGRLAIRGTPKAFSIHGPLALTKGSLYGERFDRGKVELTVTEKEVLFKKAALDQEKSRIEGEGEIGYAGTYSLTLKANRLRIGETHFFQSALPLLSGEVGVEVYGKGTFKKPVLKAIAAVQNLQYGEMEGVRGTVKVHWVDRSVEVEGAFPQKNFFLSGEINLTPGYPFSFQSRFDRLQIDPFLKGRLSGPLSNMRLLASGELKGAGKMARLEQTSLTGSFSEMQADFSGYAIENNGPVSLSSTEGAFKIESARFKGENTALEFNGGLALLKEWNLFVTGEADLNLIKFFTKEIASGKGKAHLDLRISDRWEQPQIRGELTLENGTIRTETLSQALHITSLALAFNERQLILETFEGEMGRGRFRGNGKADLAGFGIGAFSFLLTLDEARLHLLPDLSATLDGELLFQRKGKSQTLQGELTVKKAVYEKRIDLKSLVANSAKAREASLPSEIPVIGQTALNIHLYGREEILINNNVAKIPLEIDLFIKGSFDQPLLIGRVDLPEGHVYFRRNDFQIVAGSVEFLNPNRIDPTLNIRAKTEVQNLPPNNVRYSIDVVLTGTLSRFTLTLTSFPSLPEADILSLLTVGKTTAEVALAQRGGGGGEATSFVVSEILEGSIQKLTGVDRIQVDPYTSGSGTKSSSGTRLTAEKSLLDGRLLVIYTTSTDPSEEDLIRMVYEVNKNVSLFGKRDDKGQIGGGLRFRFEFR